MSSNFLRKALISVSSFNGAIFPDGSKTGVFFTEALHPFEVFTAAGFEVQFASETGSFAFDEFSLTPGFLSGSDKAVYENHDHPFMMKLRSQLKKASDLNGADFSVFFASAGHAALYDYPTASGIAAAVADIWARGGIVGATCHGAALLPNVTDGKTGKSIIEGKTVTGFTTEGEQILGILDRLKKDGVLLIEDAVTAAGALYSSPFAAFDDYSITSGRIVTGTNPASAKSAAERVVRLFDKLTT